MSGGEVSGCDLARVDLRDRGVRSRSGTQSLRRFDDILAATAPELADHAPVVTFNAPAAASFPAGAGTTRRHARRSIA